MRLPPSVGSVFLVLGACATAPTSRPPSTSESLAQKRYQATSGNPANTRLPSVPLAARDRILAVVRLCIDFDADGPQWATLVGVAAEGISASRGTTSPARSLPPDRVLAALNDALFEAWSRPPAATEDELVETAARAIAVALDDDSRYLSRRDVSREAFAGYDATFGLVLGKASPFPVVLALERGSVAEAAYIRAGEEVLKVDGRWTEGHDLREVIGWLSSAIESDVVLTLAFAGESTRTVTLNRASLDRTGAIGCRLLDRSILYLRAKTLRASTSAQIREAARSAGDMAQRLVLDLRGTTGGSPEVVLAIADLFVESGGLAEVVGFSGRDRRSANPGDLLEASRVVVLVDGATEGGAEVIAAAVQDRKRAHVLGQKTAGRARVHGWWMLGGGDALQITTARLLRAGGATLDGVGVTPDEVGAAGTSGRTKAVQDVACPGAVETDPVASDPGVMRAVDLLRSR